MAGLALVGVEFISFTGAVVWVCAEHGVDITEMVLVVLTQTQLIFLHWQRGWDCVAGDTAGTGDQRDIPDLMASSSVYNVGRGRWKGMDVQGDGICPPMSP